MLTEDTPDVRTTLIHRADSPGGQWWRSAVIYQVYPRSFADSDGDGIGDLPGITARLGHLSRLGVDAVWLSPFYTSPQHDAGYDVADYRQVDPLFGTLEDADALLARARTLGLRVLVDLVPNHTSDEHAWFRAALPAPAGSPERERYIFRDGRGPDGAEAPNNWRSVFGGPAWTRVTDADGTPGQWYLHLFDVHQPDLNWENEEVRAEFEAILRFWLDRGVDGFRVDVAHGLVKDQGFEDWAGHAEMIAGDDAGEEGVGPAPMWDQPGVHEIYRRWHEVLASYDGDRALVAEAWADTDEAMARYIRPDEMHQAFNFDFLCTEWSAPALKDSITEGLAACDSVGAPTTWVLSNHDVVRATSRLGLPTTGKGPNGIGADDPQPDADLGARRARAAALLMFALPGSAYIYQGEELGLPEHTALPGDVRQDPAFWRSGYTEKGRDGCRVPLPWEADAPAFGFSPTGASWLPQPTAWAAFALDAQKGVAGSSYELFRKALRLRREFDLGTGSLAWVEGSWGPEQGLLVFTNRQVIVAVNLSDGPIPLPDGLDVILASGELRGELGHQALPADTAVWAVLED
ncbi:glycoside hydrolase family 13 protein [Occultella gossypii]|uniref:Glycoside hydrolase family 13 protein n=1 Tax=Occultella gossypii TaxID=2800820 RepID=A0ABS7S574_9MICO|nr:glycoside hydrolase family 13 protein [Occultella gossypii]MBZ2195267.1 glycoside hydrolase family 13 protein [Occultella gossypii]